jgi:hypothetical protein
MQNAANRAAAAAAAAASRPTSAVADHLTWSDPYGATAAAVDASSAAGSAAAAPKHNDLVKLQKQLDEQCSSMGLATELACGAHAGVYELYQQMAANKLKLAGEVRTRGQSKPGLVKPLLVR